jgi:CelD/BcsL family acetyltransferase involved in cellulose biosynthesis
MLRTSVLGGPDCMAEICADWQDLAKNSPTATPFQSWEWQNTWLSFYRRTKKPHLVAIYEGSDLVGLMPLTRTGGPWRTIRAMGSGPSDYLHPLARLGYEASVAAVVADQLRELAKVDLIDLHQVRETQPLVEHFNPKMPIEQATCLLLDLPPTYDEYLATLSKSLRYDVRRLEKSLFKEGKAVVEQVTEGQIGTGLDILFEQHKLRWRKRGLPGAFIGRAQAFHHAWGRLAIREGWLWLSILKLEGEPIGAIYAMRMGNTCYFYQAGFDPSKGSISPGTLLVAATIRRAIEEGLEQFDFMRGDEPYKRRWKPQHEYKNLRLLHPHNPHRGGMGASWNEVGSKVEAKIRARLEGKSLK